MCTNTKSITANPVPGVNISSPGSKADERRPGRFRLRYEKIRAKGKWFLIGFFVYYLVRDTLLYIVLPYYAGKYGFNLFEFLF